MARGKRKPVDREDYNGYVIVLPSFDWDEDYEVHKDGQLLKKFPDRAEAKKWIDSQTTKGA